MKSCLPTPLRLSALLISLGLSGCVSGGSPARLWLANPVAQSAEDDAGTTVSVGSVSSVPLVELVSTVYEPVLEPVLEDPIEVRVDEILTSPVLGDEEFTAAVDQWIEYWGGRGSTWLPGYLTGMGIFGESVDSVLAENDLPPSLRYLPFIESGYNPKATSHASAVGLWQFMQGTATGWGMEVTPLIDERRDPVKSTEGAVGFLLELREDLGSWFLALAGYNSGPNRVRRILNRYAPDEQPTDSLFWALRGHFPRETQEFVPKLISAIIVGGSPQDFGIEPVSVDRFAYDVATVPDATSFDVVARAAEVSQEEIERLNPKYLRGMTIPGQASSIRLPEGRGETFRVNYAKIPAEERVTVVQHRVVSGETLSHIARQYGSRVSDIQAANPGVRARYLRVGALLIVPVVPRARTSVAAGGG